MSSPLKPLKRAKSTRPCFRTPTPIYSNDLLIANFPELKQPNAASIEKKRDYFGFNKPYKSVEQTSDFNTMFNNDELYERLIKPKIVPTDLVFPAPEKVVEEANKPDTRAEVHRYSIPLMDTGGTDQSYIEHMWKDIIDPQINSPLETKLAFRYQNHPSKLRRSASVRHIGYKAIRVFVSSTFTDFFNEREVLVKQVFPELREWCFERNLDLIECDLRWGVPIDSTSDQTILACMNELDRCYEDNDGQPFFIGMLGQKYGWVPEMTKLSPEIVEQYNWVPRVSITFMEFLHGALRSKNKNACFFIRDKCSLDEIPDEYKEKFFESDQFSKLQLEYEKKKLREYHPTQVFDYKCHYAGIDESTGRKKVKLDGLVEFGQTVLSFFKHAIGKTYPDSLPKTDVKKSLNSPGDKYEEVVDQLEHEMEDIHQRMFIDEKLTFFIGRQVEFRKLVDFIEKDQRVCEGTRESMTNLRSLSLDDDGETASPRAKVRNKNSVIVTGPEGCGKTSLMSYLANYLDEKHNVFYHFHNASARSQTIEVLRLRFVKFFSSYLGCPELLAQFLKTGSTESQDIMVKLCEQLNSFQDEQGASKLIILIDGLENNIKFHSHLIPTMQLASPNIKVIYSISSSFRDIIYDTQTGRVLDDCCDVLELENLDIETSRLFIKTFLGKYNKKLDDKQMALMLTKFESTTPPLWLMFACNELRIFGEFTMLTNLIRDLPNDLTGLLTKIIKRIDAEFKGEIVRKILCAIEVSEIGVPESDTIKLFAEFKSESSNQDDEDMTNLLWSQIMRNLRPFLAYSQFFKTQLICFTHKCLSSVVQGLYLDNSDETHTAKYYHLKLIDYYKDVCKYRKFSSQQICFHYKQLGDRLSLAKYLRSKDAYFHMNAVLRTMVFQEIRCRFHTIPEEAYKLKMCFGCYTRVGDLSPLQMNRNVCYLCGAVIFQPTSVEAHVCMNHRDLNVPENMFRCCICKNLKSVNTAVETLKPVYARVCGFCGNGRACCMISSK